MEMFWQTTIAGLETGSLYALAALGLVLIFRTSDIINFAQGDMAMFSTFVAFTLFNYTGSYPVAFIGALVFAAIFGFLMERVFIRPASKANLVSKMIITLGMIMIVGGLAGAVFGTDSLYFRKALLADNITLGGIVVQPNALFIISLTLVIMAVLFYVINRTKVGIAIRATAQNENTARLMGIPVLRIYSLSWIIATVLGATAGILVAPTTNVSINMMAEIHLKSFIAAVLGGFNSFIGPVVGGFILGVLDNMVGLYISLKWKTVIVYGLLIIILIVKPTGLFGQVHRKKV